MATTFKVELNGNICLPHEKRVDFYHKMKLPVFVIKVRYDRQPYTYGGGMGVIGEGIVLTSARVIGKNPTEILLRSYDGTEFTTAELLHNDWTRDLVLLRKCQKATAKTGAEPPDVFHYVEFCPAECINVGMQVFSISHPQSFGYTLTIGEIAYPASTEEDLCPTTTCIEQSVNRRRIMDCRFLTDRRYLSWKGLRPDLHVIQVNNIHGGNGSNGSPVFNASGQVIGMRILGLESFDFCVHVDTLRRFLQQWEKRESKGGPSSLARTPSMRVKHSDKGQGKGSSSTGQTMRVKHSDKGQGKGSSSTGQRTHGNMRLNVVGENERVRHRTGGSCFAQQYSENVMPGFSALSLSGDCLTQEDTATGTTIMHDDNAKSVDSRPLLSSQLLHSVHLPTFGLPEHATAASIVKDIISKPFSATATCSISQNLSVQGITKSSTYTNVTMQREKKLVRYSERKLEVPPRTVSKLSKSGLTKKNTLSSSSLKRKILEELKIDTKSSNSSRSVMESIIRRRAIFQNLDVSPTVHKKTVLGTQNPEEYLGNVSMDSFSNSNYVPKMKNVADLEPQLLTENSGNVATSESCVKVLDDVWNMLKKVNEEAKELLASCVTKNSAAMILNHPMYNEKIRALERFVNMQVPEI